jgi:hypothetical protein
MTYESEWNGFVTQSQSGIAEALYAAGVDCSVHLRGELVSYGDSISTPDYLPQPVSEAQRI